MTAALYRITWSLDLVFCTLCFAPGGVRKSPFPPRNLFELPLFGESEDFWVELKEITVSTVLSIPHC